MSHNILVSKELGNRTELRSLFSSVYLTCSNIRVSKHTKLHFLYSPEKQMVQRHIKDTSARSRQQTSPRRPFSQCSDPVKHNKYASHKLSPQPRTSCPGVSFGCRRCFAAKSPVHTRVSKYASVRHSSPSGRHTISTE